MLSSFEVSRLYILIEFQKGGGGITLIQRSEINFQALVLTFHHLGAGDQAFCLGLYSLAHLHGLCLFSGVGSHVAQASLYFAV